MVASHVTEPGSSPTESGAMIKFSDFSSHPGTCMLYSLIKPAAMEKLMAFPAQIYAGRSVIQLLSWAMCWWNSWSETLCFSET